MCCMTQDEHPSLIESEPFATERVAPSRRPERVATLDRAVHLVRVLRSRTSTESIDESDKFLEAGRARVYARSSTGNIS